jgi:hypothetical protein
MSEKLPTSADSTAKARAHTATDALARVLMGAERLPMSVLAINRLIEQIHEGIAQPEEPKGP